MKIENIGWKMEQEPGYTATSGQSKYKDLIEKQKVLFFLVKLFIHKSKIYIQYDSQI